MTRSLGRVVKMGSASVLVSRLSGDSELAMSEVMLDIKLQMLSLLVCSSFEKQVEDVERAEFFRWVDDGVCVATTGDERPGVPAVGIVTGRGVPI